MNYTVYLAGPITGLSYEKAMGWREEVASALPDNIKTINPLEDCEFLVGVKEIAAEYKEVPGCAGVDIVSECLGDIQQCDLILANLLDAERISIGTCVELGYAAALRKPIVLVVEPGGIHNQPFIVEPALCVAETLEWAIKYIGGFLTP